MSIDLILQNAHLLDATSGIDWTGWIGLNNGLIHSIGQSDALVPAAKKVVDIGGCLVVPGLVDIHTHLYEGVSHYGVNADNYCLRRGVTTAADAGSSGAQTFPGFRRHIIERSATRVLAFLNIAVAGMISPLVGELEDLRWASVEDTVACALDNGDVVVGIKVRLSRQQVGEDAMPALRLARDASDRLSLPMMVHITDMPMELTELLPYLTKDDIITHCFHGHAGGILDERGRVFGEVRGAAERGVVFDVGHGVGSFSFRVAEKALAQNMPPTTISSDLHRYGTGGPVYDLVTTMSKLICLGMSIPDVVAMSTARPASALHLDGLGALRVGNVADLAVLKITDGRWDLRDADGEVRRTEELLVPEAVVKSGSWQPLSSPVASMLAQA